MSERGELAVLVPVNRWPETPVEKAELVEAASQAAVNLLRDSGADPRKVKLLGVKSATKAAHPITDELVVKFVILVEAPEDFLAQHTTRTV